MNNYVRENMCVVRVHVTFDFCSLSTTQHNSTQRSATSLRLGGTVPATGYGPPSRRPLGSVVPYLYGPAPDLHKSHLSHHPQRK